MTDCAKANSKQDGIPKLELVNSIFAHASVFIKTLLGNTERSVEAVLRVAGSRVLVRLAVTKILIDVYYLPTKFKFLRDQRGCRKMS